MVRFPTCSIVSVLLQSMEDRTNRVCGHMVLNIRHTDYALSPNVAFSDWKEKWWHHISEIMGYRLVRIFRKNKMKKKVLKLSHNLITCGVGTKRGGGEGGKREREPSPSLPNFFPFSLSRDPWFLSTLATQANNLTKLNFSKQLIIWSS